MGLAWPPVAARRFSMFVASIFPKGFPMRSILKPRLAFAALFAFCTAAAAAFAADCENGICRLQSKPPTARRAERAAGECAACNSTYGSTHYYSGHRRGRIAWRITHPFGGRFRRR